MKTEAQKRAHSKWQKSASYRSYQKKYREDVKNRARLKKYHRNHYLQRAFGITAEQYEDLFLSQRGCCDICGIHQAELKQRLHVDHCHATGRIRGLLCQLCNHLLGNAKDNSKILQSAISYLMKPAPLSMNPLAGR